MRADDARVALARVGVLRAEGERLRAQAMREFAVVARAAVDAGVPVAQVARLAGVTRKTVYETLARGR